ncbi:MAG: hypothetical protein GY941_30710 [Planctomycetes bacterium]|nr:hypothetical protein [Planctomycetota bacterium]
MTKSPLVSAIIILNLLAFYYIAVASNWVYHAVSGYSLTFQDVSNPLDSNAVSDLLTFMFVAKACAIAEDGVLQMKGTAKDPSGTFVQGNMEDIGKNQRNTILPWLVSSNRRSWLNTSPRRLPFSSSYANQENANSLLTPYDKASRFFNNGDVYIVFGELNPARYKKSPGNVYPYCGSLVIERSFLDQKVDIDIQSFYFDLVSKMWQDKKITEAVFYFVNQQFNGIPIATIGEPLIGSSAMPEKKIYVPSKYSIRKIDEHYVTLAKTIISNIVEDIDFQEKSIFNVKLNRSIEAINNLPKLFKQPAIMSYTASQKKLLNLDNLDSPQKEIMVQSLNYPRGQTERNVETLLERILRMRVFVLKD